MIKAQLPNDELKRLQALYGYEILDTEAEKVFDDLTLLASQICDTPIALISLIDPERQWFKSKVGLDADQTSRDIAFCSHAILESEVFEINDASKDERFFDNPLVTDGPKIRFYAGAQLMTPSGHAIGTLCAIDDKPHELTDFQRNALEILGREVISQMELRCKVRQLELVSKRKSDFLSNVSHELRTPLNAIVNFSRLMLSNLQNQSQSPKLTEYAGYVDTASKHLLNLVNSVLDLGKIEQGKLELNTTATDVRHLFEQLHGVMSVQAEAKSIELCLNIGQTVNDPLMLDEAKVRQIVLNLVSNSIKFTPEGGLVLVMVNVAENGLNIQVQDNGCGISKSDQQQLFEKYHQVGEQKGVEGTGLGLSITKGLVELMEGEIELSSELGRGTKIEVTLPAVLADKQPAVSDSCDVRIVNNCEQRVLLVEDTPINQKVALAIFDSIGVSADLAKNGEQAIEMVASNVYDIVFMDLHLPGIEGHEAAAQIHQSQPELPIIALTADVFHDDNPEDAVFKDKLLKPLETEKLIAILNQWS